MTTDVPYAATRFDPPHIDGFEILSTAGTGGMSVVYRARQLGLDRVVAIKMLHKHLLLDGNSVQRFVKEGRLATKLNHPNIATVMNCGTTASNEPYLVMEFLEGKSLKEKLEADGTLSASEFRDLFIQICAGLKCAHDSGVVHRDLKPGNIVLVPNSDGGTIPKIVDFGIAKFIDLPTTEQQKLTQTGSFIGSPTYTSPEQCTSQTVDARSDIYSLGCMMYESLAGRPPFTSDNIFEITSAHLNEVPQTLNTVARNPIPNNVNDIVMQCLQKNPDDRPQSVSNVLNVLTGTEQAAVAKPQLKAKRTPSNTKSNTKQLLAIASGVIVVALAVYALNLPHTGGVNPAIGAADRAIKARDYAKAAQLLEQADIVSMSPEMRDKYAEKEYELGVAAIQDNNLSVYNQAHDSLLRQRGTIKTAQVFDWCLQHDAAQARRQYELLPSLDHASQLREDSKGNPYIQYLFESRLASNVYSTGRVSGVPKCLHDALIYAKESGRPSAIAAALYSLWQWRYTYKEHQSAESTVDEAMKSVPALSKESDFLSAQAAIRLGEPLMGAGKFDWKRTKLILDAVDQIATRTAFPSLLEAQVAYDKARMCQSQGDFDGMLRYGEKAMKSRYEALHAPANCLKDPLFKQTYSDFIMPQVEKESKRATAAKDWKRALEMAEHLQKQAEWADDTAKLSESYERIYQSRRHINPNDADKSLLESAVSLARKEGLDLALCRTLSELGAEQFSARDYSKAATALEEVYGRIKDHPELRKGRVATAPITLARTYIRLNQKEKAKPLFAAYFREAEKEYGSTSDFIKLSRAEYEEAFPNDAKSL